MIQMAALPRRADPRVSAEDRARVCSRGLRAPGTAITAMVVVFAAFTARATLNPDQARGVRVATFQAPHGGTEICVVPKHFADGMYSSQDEKREATLCALDFYRNAAVCPKLNSTNPGLDIHEVPAGYTVGQVEAANCRVKDPSGAKAGGLAKKIAKYKLSTSCSYTPSILSYYHLSRALGDVLNVPPAVLRTLDREQHIAFGGIALKQTRQGSLIQQTWLGLMAQLRAGPGAARRDLLLTDRGDQSYGALVENPGGESFYKAFFNGGANNVARTANLRDHNPIIALLARPGRIDSRVGHEFTADNVQAMVQLRDAANMIVMDTLLNQQDRMGNIHAVERYYYLDVSVPGEASVKSVKPKDLDADEVKRRNAVAVSEMLLKDNDCGVAKQNIDRQAGLADKIAHIDPDTYERLLRLDREADQPAVKAFFVDELLYTPADYASVRANLGQLASKLHQACVAGRLSLDLDLQAHFAGRAPASRGCDVN